MFVSAAPVKAYFLLLLISCFSVLIKLEARSSLVRYFSAKRGIVISLVGSSVDYPGAIDVATANFHKRVLITRTRATSRLFPPKGKTELKVKLVTLLETSFSLPISLLAAVPRRILNIKHLRSLRVRRLFYRQFCALFRFRDKILVYKFRLTNRPICKRSLINLFAVKRRDSDDDLSVQF